MRISNEVKEVYKNQIVELYVQFVEKKHKDPTSKEFSKALTFNDTDNENGVSSWRDIFKNISEVRGLALQKYPERIENATFTEEEFGSIEYKEKVEDIIKSHKKFIITTAVNNKMVDIEFFNSLVNYAKLNDAALLFVLSHDVRSAKRVFEFNCDPALKCGSIITEDTRLNNNLMISSITASAKQIHPSSGLLRYAAQLDATIIFPGCKQEQQHIAELDPSYRAPHSILVMGACTVPDYSSDKIIAGRTNWMAEKDHQLGAAIVELEDEDRFHLRVVQASRDGSFTDLGTSYHPDGSTTVTRDARYVLGDAHIGGNPNDKLVNTIVNQVKSSPWISEVLIHDLENATSVSHHEENDYIQRVIRFNQHRESLIEESNLLVKYLNKFLEIPNLTISVVNSNHDRHIDRYIAGLRAVFTRDFVNMTVALDMFNKMSKKEITCPLQYLVEEVADEKLLAPERIQWLQRDKSYKVYGCELGRHGDEGKNGARGNLQVYQTNVYNAVIAHSHSAGIRHKVFQVGMTGDRNQDYNHGLSSWTHTNCLVYEDGTKQLIDFIPNVEGGYTFNA